jgi:hypothetical protein
MYGLVNKGIQGLVTERAGQEGWKRVAEQANVASPFLSMETYPDDVTFALAAAAAEELDRPLDQFLRELGRYWVLYTGREGYSDMFSMWGNDMPTFLANLDLMHERVKSSMPHLEPPQFSTSEESEGVVRLTYRSHREAMAPMVVGLLEGLADRFGSKVDVEHVVFRKDAGHDEFLVTLSDG